MHIDAVRSGGRGGGGANKEHFGKCGSGVFANFFSLSSYSPSAEVVPKNKPRPVSLTCSLNFGEFNELTGVCYPKSLVPVSRKSR